MAKAFTTDYEHFADVKIGLLPYLAESTKEIFHNDDPVQLKKFMEDIAFVADNLYDLLDEVDAAKIKYDQLRNRIAAIEKDKAEKESALAAIKATMEKEFGTKHDDDAVPELVFDSPEGEKVVPMEQPKEPSLSMSAEDKAFMEEMLTFENVVDPSSMPPDENELLRESGLVFNDEIDQLSKEHAEMEYDFDDDDDGLYNDFVDEYAEDVDDGYVPLDVPKLDNGDEDISPLPPLASADAALIGDMPDTDELFDDMPDAEDDLEDDEDDDAVLSDFFDSNDAFMDMFLDGDDEPNGSDASEGELPPSEKIEDDDDDIIPSGFVDPSFL